MPKAQLPIIMDELDYAELAPEISENSIVAIVQPKPVFIKGSHDQDLFHSFSTGCAGKIASISNIKGEISISIQGVCRFDVIEDFQLKTNSFERVEVSYDRYLVDFEEKNVEQEWNKTRLLNALDIYFRRLEISPNWKEIQETPFNVLVSALAMACPFHPSEKQSLLETVDIKDQSDMITKIIEINSFDRYNTASTVN